MDVMIDIETLGTHATAHVLSIGAAAFSRDTGHVYMTYYNEIAVSSALKGREVSGDTLVWWMKQSDAARKQAFGGEEETEIVLLEFTSFLREVKQKHGSYKVWGNGATFDITILSTLYEQYDMEVPWNFWDVRDCRTIEDVSSVKRSSVKRKGTHHNALHDAVYQAQYISKMLNSLK